MEHTENPRLAMLYEQYDDIIFEIALVKLQDRELKHVHAAEADAEEEMQSKTFFEKTQVRSLSVINRALRGRRVRYVIRRTIPRIAMACACALLVAFVSLTTAVATVQPVRARVLRLIMEIEERYTTINLQEDADTLINVPPEWKGKHYLSYVPDGYSFVCISEDGISAFYQSTLSETIQFTECEDEDAVRFDTENAITTGIEINGASAMLFESDGFMQMIWQEGNSVLKLSGTIAREDAVDVALGICRISQIIG